jgi:signal transduction histidine kinase
MAVETFARFLGADEDWERPGPAQQAPRSDIGLAVGWYAVAALGIELLRSMGALTDGPGPVWQHLAVASAAALLVWRRSRPLTVAGASALHMLVTGVLMPPVMASLPMQVLYFFALYSGVAWARDRRVLSYVVGGVVSLMFCWLAWQFAVGSGVEEIRANLGASAEDTGLLPPVAAALGYTFLVNVLYFGGAVLLGQVAWRAALRTDQVLRQAETIRGQSERLRDQAVVAERLRIARELHDVVAHHVSVMGVQAAAAGRVLDRDPAAAREALAAVSSSSRAAVGQMRDLLGTLRSGEVAAGADPATIEPARAPQPALADLVRLVEEMRVGSTRQVTHSLVQDRPDAVDAVPPQLQLTAYRIVQEALTNIRRHSTATRVSVTVRAREELEVEVLDNGRPRPGTSGTGMGLLGIRERVQILGGTAEIGSRHGGGFRVRVVLPLVASEAGVSG